MPELRWTLLVLGALFIGALAWWELRRQRQASRNGIDHASSPGTTPTGFSTGGGDRVGLSGEGGGNEGRVYREPTITFPELQPEVRSGSEMRAPARGREPTPDIPLVELDGDSFSGLRVEGETGVTEEPAILAEPPEDWSADIADEDVVTAQFNVGVENEPSHVMGYGRRDVEVEMMSVDVKAAGEAAADESASEGNAAAGGAAASSAPVAPAGASAAGDPVVSWPSEETRKIIALRLVSAPAARFSGRTVRMALAAEGFVLGKFDIFHKAGPDSRAVLSAASLTKPGTFTMNTIDGQRFGGLSLFAVLPGPLPAQRTFDELLITARNLNDRLEGALQDERGEPLTPVRSTSIRDSLGEPPEMGDAHDYEPGKEAAADDENATSAGKPATGGVRGGKPTGSLQ